MGAKAPPGYGRNRPSAAASFKLWAAVVIANLVGIGVAVYVGNAMRAVPDTAGVETALRLSFYAAIGIAAIADAFLVDELVFGGAFRLTQLEGRTAATLDKNASNRQILATFRRSSMTFPMVARLCGVVTYLFFNLVNRDFSDYDAKVGVYISDLRGDAPEDRVKRLKAIDALSSRVRPEVRPILLRSLAREDAELAAWAAWAIGRLHQPQSADKQRPFELRPHVVKELVKAQRRPEPVVAREALIALGRVQHRPSADEIQAALSEMLDADAKTPATIDLRLIWALGLSLIHI